MIKPPEHPVLRNRLAAANLEHNKMAKGLRPAQLPDLPPFGTPAKGALCVLSVTHGDKAYDRLSSALSIEGRTGGK